MPSPKDLDNIARLYTHYFYYGPGHVAMRSRLFRVCLVRFYKTILTRLYSKFASSVSELCSSTSEFVSKLPKSIISLVTHTGVMIYQLMQGNGVLDYTAAIYQFFGTQCDLTSHVTDLASRFATAFAAFYENIVPSQSLKDGFDYFRGVYEKILSSRLCSLLRDIISSAISLKFFSKDFSKRFGRVFGKTKSCSLLDFFRQILDSLSIFLECCDAYVRGDEIVPVLVGDSPVQQFIENSRIRISQYAVVGNHEDDILDMPTYMRHCDELLDLGRVISGTIQNHDVLYPQFLANYNELRTLFDTLTIKLRAASRTSPCTFIISGHPGIGKTYITKATFASWSRGIGRENHAGLVHTKTAGATYWEGLDPIRQPYLSLSELGFRSNHFAKNDMDPDLIDFLSLASADDKPLDMAFDAKGKIRALFELIVGNTNNPDLHVRRNFYSPGAFFRRIHRVNVLIDPDFRKAGGTEVDPEKVQRALDSGDCKSSFDIYTMQIFTYTANGNEAVERLEVELNYHEYCEYIRLAAVEYRANAERETLLTQEADGVEVKSQSLSFVDPSTVSLLTTAAPYLYKAYVGYFAAKTFKDNGSINYPNFSLAFAFAYTTGFWWPMLLAFICASGFQIWQKYSDLRQFGFAHVVSSTIREGVYSALYLPYLFRFRDELPNMWREHRYKVIASICALFSTIIGGFLFYSRSKKINSQDLMSEIDEKLDSELPRERVKVKTRDAVWNVVRRDMAPAVHKDVPSELFPCISKNLYVFHVIRDGRRHTQYGLGVRGNYVLINRHFFPPHFDTIDITMSDDMSSSGVKIHLPFNHVQDVTSDLCIFSFHKRSFTDITKHFPDAIDYPSLMDTFFCEQNTISMFPRVVTFNTPHGDKVHVKNAVYTTAGNRSGLCGYPLLGFVNSGSQIVGIHSGGMENEHEAYAIPVTRSELLSAVKTLNERSTFIETYSQALVLDTQLPIPKSLVRHEDLPGVEYRGKLPGKVLVNSKSKLVCTGFTPSLIDIFFRHFSHVRETVYKPPLMRPVFRNNVYVSPWNYAARKIGKVKPPIMISDCEDVLDTLRNRFIPFFLDKGITISPVSVEVALNGYYKDSYTRSMNLSTSPGYGLTGKKSDYVEELKLPEGSIGPKGNEFYFELTEEVKSQVSACFESYSRKEMSGFFIQSCLKDEPRDIKKVEIGKTRVFYIDPFVRVLVGRMLLSPIYTLMHEFPDQFFTAIGIDMHRDADRLYERISAYPQGVAGDYSNYDQSMPEEIALIVGTFIHDLAAALGYNEYALSALDGYLSDSLFPNVVVLKDLFCVPGLQVSGKYGTAEDNSLRNLTLMIYAWKKVGLDTSDFFDKVVGVTYGDDLISCVSPDCTQLYNNFSYRTIMEDLGMGFTAPVKDQELQFLYNVEDMDFLKRRFVFWDKPNCWVAPLHLDSLFKILEWYLPSQVETPRFQLYQASHSLLRESFFHFRESERYSQFREEIISLLCSKFGETMRTLKYPTFEGIYADIYGVEVSSQALVSFVKGPAPVTNDIDVLISFFRTERDRGLSWLKEQKIDVDDDVSSLPVEARNIAMYVYDCSYTLDYLKRLKISPSDFIRKVLSQSSVGMINTVEAHLDKTDENVSDILGYDEKTVGHSSMGGDDQGQVNLLSNDDFFSRPIILSSFSLLLDSPFNGFFKVWDLYTSDPRVRAKLKNWSYLKGNLHVRIAISGTPFHYGTMLASYQPYPLRNTTLQQLLTGVANPTFRPLIMNYLSQAKGAVMMGIGENAPVEYVCPFISPKPSHRLFNSSSTVISAADSYEDLEDAGSLFFYSQNDPKSASSSPTNPTVVLTAWMTDVELGVPTATRIDVPSQSHVGPDERKVGPVERISTNIAQISGALTAVPAIAPLATASRSIFSGLASLSSIFGWSYPIEEEKNLRYRPNPFANASHSIGSSTAKKISLDPKTELGSVAPWYTDGDDELTIRHLASRPSLLTKFSWAFTSPYATVLWRSKVTPFLMTNFEIVGRGYHMPTAMGYAASPFAYWRGTIKFTFDIVVSKNHSGKLYVRYEPNLSQSALISLNMTWNTNFVQIVDITNTRRITMSVDWASPRPWQKVGGTEDTMYGDAFDASDVEFCNGYIEVGVYTGLQSPVADDVEVNVLVHCDDLQVTAPSTEHMPTNREVPFQSFVTDVESVTLAKTSANDANIALSQMGERVLSFRSLLKRYVFELSIPVPPDVRPGAKFLRFTNDIYTPPVPTYGNFVVPTISDVSLYGYLRYAFLGMRGSIRKRFRPSLLYAPTSFQRAVVSLDNPALPPPQGVVWFDGTTKLRHTGSVSEILHVNSNIEAEFPFYSPNYFAFSCADDLSGPTPPNEYIEEWFSEFDLDIDFAGTTEAGFIVVDSAIGEDFNFVYYLGPPFYKT